MLNIQEEKRGEVAMEVGSMVTNPQGWIAKQFIDKGIKSFTDSYTWRDLLEEFPPGTRIYMNEGSPIPLGSMFSPEPFSDEPQERIEGREVGFTMGPASYTAVIPETATPPIVAGDNPENVAGLDSWMWTEQLMQTRRQVAQAEAQAPTAELPPVTVTSTRLWPPLLIGALVYFVLVQ